jgi:hypothetical protein
MNLQDVETIVKEVGQIFTKYHHDTNLLVENLNKYTADYFQSGRLSKTNIYPLFLEDEKGNIYLYICNIESIKNSNNFLEKVIKLTDQLLNQTECYFKYRLDNHFLQNEKSGIIVEEYKKFLLIEVPIINSFRQTEDGIEIFTNNKKFFIPIKEKITKIDKKNNTLIVYKE